MNARLNNNNSPHDSRRSPEPPNDILCQHSEGSCGACCGVYNFKDRSHDATRARLSRRTQKVKKAWPDVAALAKTRDDLLALEKEDVLFAQVLVCPFAGFVDDERVGCLLHPSRHPRGEDLRDLAVYPKEVCRDHFCAPHEWLRERERRFAQSVRGIDYGLIVTDAGLVKSLLALLDEAHLGPVKVSAFKMHANAFDAFWKALLKWPYRDPSPHRFGAFMVVGDAAVERTMPSTLARFDTNANAKERTVLDGLSTLCKSQGDAERALAALRKLINDLAATISAPRP